MAGRSGNSACLGASNGSNSRGILSAREGTELRLSMHQAGVISSAGRTLFPSELFASVKTVILRMFARMRVRSATPACFQTFLNRFTGRSSDFSAYVRYFNDLDGSCHEPRFPAPACPFPDAKYCDQQISARPRRVRSSRQICRRGLFFVGMVIDLGVHYISASLCFHLLGSAAIRWLTSACGGVGIIPDGTPLRRKM